LTPIVNAPEVAILGVSRSVNKPVWNGKAFIPELTLPLALSYDHRVIDGAQGGRFMAELNHTIAIPRLKYFLMIKFSPDSSNEALKRG
jgi:pyruvate dehydrogenase E2 component (dihydrolipoamide acetyltransferase)